LNYEIHEAANLFPKLEEEEYQKLKEDIRRDGVQMPVVLSAGGSILDGRHRARACRELGIPVPTITWRGEFEGKSPVEYVWSLNGLRRHLSKSQLAAVAAEMLPLLEKEAKER
jgi:hypothetical protein